VTTTSDRTARADSPLVDRDLNHEVEQFLYHEAALLDGWKLEEWLDLLTLDCRYDVPPPDLPGADAATAFSLIHDSRALLEQRVIRLKKPQAHAEFPHSRTRRMISNVRVVAGADADLQVWANFTVHRFRNRTHVMFVGEYYYVLRQTPEGFRIAYRRATLDNEALQPHGKVSIIL
jgi:p-cumate 2,3-dioxygenase subunit beta